MLPSNVKIIKPRAQVVIDEQPLIQYIRVAGYARVSTGKPEQKTSFESQQKHYKSLVARHPDWIDVGLYADEGITGTSIRKRKNFIRMIEDCRAGKIDKIIVKSVSRFARNTVDCLATIEELTALNVEVYFELQNLSSIKDSKTTKLQLTLFASMAQEESETLSESVSYGIRMGIESGRYRMPKAYGYYLDENKKLKIHPQEAEEVRFIFNAFWEGYTEPQICRVPNDRGVKPPKGKAWYDSTIVNMLRNEKYAGDLMLEKTMSRDLKSRKRIPNPGNKYFVGDNHEPIISKEMFERVQREFEYRQNLRGYGKKGKAQYTTKYAFSNKLFCGHCGAKYRRHCYDIKRKDGAGIDHIYTWVCINHKLNGKDACPITQVREETLQRAFVAALNSLVDDKEGFVATVIANINVILQTELSPINIEKLRDQYASKQKELQTLMAQSVTSHDAALVARYETLMVELEELKGRIEKAEESRVTASMHRERSEELQTFLAGKQPFEKFDDMIFRKLVQKAIIKEEEVTFVFSDYLERTVPIIQ
nr:MAG TPA: integrase [Caudoviricetes sp.]